MTGSAAREDPLVWRGAVPLARGTLLREAAAIAARLPPGLHVVNLCEQREAFLLAFAACMMAERVQLMPAARGERYVLWLQSGVWRRQPHGARRAGCCRDHPRMIPAAAAPRLYVIDRMRIRAATLCRGTAARITWNA